MKSAVEKSSTCSNDCINTSIFHKLSHSKHVLVNTIKKWRSAFKKNGKLNKNGRQSGSKDVDPKPRWERKTEWRDLSTDILAAANAQYHQHGSVTLQYVANMCGKSKARVCQIMKRFKWSFYLYNYSGTFENRHFVQLNILE